MKTNKTHRNKLTKKIAIMLSSTLDDLTANFNSILYVNIFILAIRFNH